MSQMIDKIEHFHRVNMIILSQTGTVTIRVLLAGASLLFGLLLLFGAHGNTFAMSPLAYGLMAVVTTEKVWAALFILHFFGVAWRVYDPISRPYWAIAVNSFGLFVWGFSTLLINLSIDRITPSTGCEWMMVLASAWALFKTGLGKEVLSQ